jgi:Ti-type conjugative transfer relaxase TraA
VRAYTFNERVIRGEGAGDLATYSLYVQAIKRSAGRSAVRCAAYRAAEALHDERLDETHSYLRKQGVEHTEIMAPEDAPAWVFNRERLWNAAERAERRRDAQPAREVRIALPVELSSESQLEVARTFVREEFVSRGMVADFAIHREKDHNPHCHILLTMRRIGPEGFASTKERDWNRRKLVSHWREAWAYYANRALALEGHAARIDHRSYAARGIGLQPQPKLGAGAEMGDRRQFSLEQQKKWRLVARENGRIILNDPREALRALTEHQAVFTRTQLLKFLHSRTDDAAQFDACLRAVLGHKDLQSQGVDARGEEHFTSRTMLLSEQHLLESARDLASRNGHRVSGTALQRATEARTLEQDQALALAHLTRGTGDLAICEGYAGTGKSYMLGAAREAWRAQGLQVVGGALAAVAAKGLEQSSGIPSRTLASWEMAWASGRNQLTKRHVLVLDEAGMIGTRQMARILEHARAAGAKVVLVGDTRQLKPIEAGAPMKVLRDELGASLLHEIRRQKVPWQRQASLAFAEERVVDGLRAYEEKGQVHAHQTRADAIKKVIEAWQRDRAANPVVRELQDGIEVERPATDLIITFRRKDVRALNDAARAIRRQAGELGEDRDAIVRDSHGVAHQRSFATNDRICFLRNAEWLGVMNGTLGTVVRNDTTRWLVRLDDGRTIDLDLGRYNQFDHGYASTVHKDQGVTVDRAYVLASSAFNASTSYVAMTRHRVHAELHWAYDEFQKPWAQPSSSGLEGRAACTNHDDDQAAAAAAIEAWNAPAARGLAPLLVTDSAERCRKLNALARERADQSGRLGEDEVVIRTHHGALAFATGDRICLRAPVPEAQVRAGALGTVTRVSNGILDVQLDDARQVQIDTTRHRSIEYGYAVVIEQSAALQPERSIVVLREEPSERAREVLLGANLGTMEVHGLSCPPPSADSVFKALARQEQQDRAMDVQANLAEARSFAQIANLRTAYRQLLPEERAPFLAQLQRLADQPQVSRFEAIRTLPQVSIAYAQLAKAEDALTEVRAYRDALGHEGAFGEKLADALLLRGARAQRHAERAVAHATAQLEQALRDPELEKTADTLTAELNQQRARARELFVELHEQADRAARESRLATKLAALSQRYPDGALRLASRGDFNRPLTYVGTLPLGSDSLALLRDRHGTTIAFDAKRIRLDMTALERGAALQISPNYEVVRGRAAHRGRSL